MTDERWDEGPSDEAAPAPRTAKPHPFGHSAASEFSTDAAQSTATDLSGHDDEFLTYMLRYKGQGDWSFPGE